MKPLNRGSYGSDVKQVQLFLIGLGLLEGAADGGFGPKTEAAVIQYQKSRRLLPDGQVGNATIHKMMGEGFALMQPVANGNFPAKPSFGPITSNAQRMAIFGKFEWRHDPVKGNPENITVLGDWAERNLVRVELEQLKKRGLPVGENRRFHKIVAGDVDALFNEWEAEGLLGDIISYDGDYVPRFVRGSRVTLSNHAFGSAFDINAEWNGLGRTPARTGAKGSVLRLVKIANKHNFYWGGHFSRLDGMHFEHIGRKA